MPKRPLLSCHEVVSPRIARPLDGLRIAQISDLHVRTGVKPKRLHAAVEMINEAKPHFLALTGDYVCLSPRPLPNLTAALKDLAVPAYATLGNHDHWSGAAKVRSALEAAGVHVLTNEHRVLDFGNTPLHLIGVDDSVTGHHDPEAAFRGVPQGATTVVLSHDPQSADWLAPFRPALVLSGHTHGGQVYFRRLTPFIAARLRMKYLSGFFEVQGSVLFVNRGLGANVPLRFRAPVEVACLTLRSGPATPAVNRGHAA
ncbi:MAG: metallophosphoesterase [Myxococcota bacterium]